MEEPKCGKPGGGQARKPCLNSKKINSPNYETPLQLEHETRALSLSRADDALRGVGDACCGRARRRPRARRRTEPGADHGVPAGTADASGRYQWRRRTPAH